MTAAPSSSRASLHHLDTCVYRVQPRATSTHDRSIGASLRVVEHLPSLRRATAEGTYETDPFEQHASRASRVLLPAAASLLGTSMFAVYRSRRAELASYLTSGWHRTTVAWILHHELVMCTAGATVTYLAVTCPISQQSSWDRGGTLLWGLTAILTFHLTALIAALLATRTSVPTLLKDR